MKKIVSILLIAAMSVGLMACGGGNNDQGASNGAAVDTTTLKINLASEPDYLDPALNSSVDGGCLAVNSFVGLHTYDANGTLIPALASEYSVSEDGTVYTFKLIESKWSNGDALTAKDFVYSWNRVADPATAADYSYLFDILAKNEDGTLKIEAPDDYTFVVTLASPCPYLLDITAFPTFFPVHQASVEAANPDGVNPGAWCQEAGFVCNGAYTLESWSHNESMVYVKNPNYYDAANVTLNGINYQVVDGSDNALTAFKNGTLDISVISGDQVGAVEKDATLSKNLNVTGAGYMWYVTFSQTKNKDSNGDFANADLRLAFANAIDREFLVDNYVMDGSLPTYTCVPPQFAASATTGEDFSADQSRFKEYCDYNLESAQAHFEDAKAALGY